MCKFLLYVSEALFTLLAFSSFTVFILLRLVVAGFALFLTLKLFWLAIWNMFLDVCPLSLFLAIISGSLVQLFKFQVTPYAHISSVFLRFGNVDLFSSSLSLSSIISIQPLSPSTEFLILDIFFSCYIYIWFFFS